MNRVTRIALSLLGALIVMILLLLLTSLWLVRRPCPQTDGTLHAPGRHPRGEGGAENPRGSSRPSVRNGGGSGDAGGGRLDGRSAPRGGRPKRPSARVYSGSTPRPAFGYVP